MDETPLDLLHLQAHKLLAQDRAFSTAAITAIEPIVGDGSTRQYVRLRLSGCEHRSAVMMVLRAWKDPLGGGRNNLSQDDTFVEMARFFASHKIPVPNLYIDARKDKLLLVEDVGSVGLWEFAFGRRGVKDLPLPCSDPVLMLYKRAIDIIAQLQSIAHDDNCVAFQRSCTLEQYRREASEFVQYFIPAKLSLSRSEIESISSFHDTLCRTLMEHPRTLSHFDYMSFNLFVDPQGQVRVVDFQDASLNSAARDVLALINDRDVDFALGKERHAELLRYAASVLTFDKDLLDHYYQYLLHWCFRVAGRFVLLSEKRGKPAYQAWIPGTLRRLGRTLATPQAQALPGASAVFDLLSKACPEVDEGASGLWPGVEA